MDAFERTLWRLTCAIAAERFRIQNERHERGKLMAIEIKGLKSDALLARANLDKVRAAYRKFNEAAPAHAADVDKLAGDITGMQSDLEFAAALMGNSADASEKLSDGQKPPMVPPNILAGSGDLNELKTAPEAPLVRLGSDPSNHAIALASQEAAGEASQTFHHEL